MTSADSVLREALAPVLAASGVDVESVEVTRAGRRQVVRVVIDRDGGVDLDAVAEASRLISTHLDEGIPGGVFDGPYVLEVTSPGVDRPLTEQRHWRRAVGRLVRLDMVDGTVIEGRIVDVPDEAGVTLRVADEERVIDRAAIRRAIVQVEFSSAAKQGEPHPMEED